MNDQTAVPRDDQRSSRHPTHPVRDSTALDSISAENNAANSGLDQTLMDDILDALEAGKKLDAVKLYKDASGLSLMESKQFIENLMDQLDFEPPVVRSRWSMRRVANILLAMYVVWRLLRGFF